MQRNAITIKTHEAVTKPTRAKRKEQERTQADVERFLAQGGEIQQLPSRDDSEHSWGRIVDNLGIFGG